MALRDADSSMQCSTVLGLSKTAAEEATNELDHELK